MLSFPSLVYTGITLKYPEKWWARPLLQWEEHTSFRGSLHRTAAVVLIAATLYLQPWPPARGAALREVQLRREAGVLGSSVGHSDHDGFRFSAVVQQFCTAAFPQMGFRCGHSRPLV